MIQRKIAMNFSSKYFIIIGSVVLEATTLIKAKFELKSRLDKQPTRVSSFKFNKLNSLKEI